MSREILIQHSEYSNREMSSTAMFIRQVCCANKQVRVGTRALHSSRWHSRLEEACGPLPIPCSCWGWFPRSCCGEETLRPGCPVGPLGRSSVQLGGVWPLYGCKWVSKIAARRRRRCMFPCAVLCCVSDTTDAACNSHSSCD